LGDPGEQGSASIVGMAGTSPAMTIPRVPKKSPPSEPVAPLASPTAIDGLRWRQAHTKFHHALEGDMRKMMSLGIVAVFVAAAITAWAATAPRSKNPESKNPEIVAVEINPLALMKASSGLQVEEWQWF
jgi:hypothetical protein